MFMTDASHVVELRSGTIKFEVCDPHCFSLTLHTQLLYSNEEFTA